MKKFVFSLLLIFSFVFVQKVFAAEHIQDYSVNLDIQQNGDLKVKEIIDYDFDTLQRHGIYRNIPIEYTRDGKSFTLNISHVQVVQGDGQAYKFTTSREENQLVIKVGDEKTLITGMHEYILTYDVKKPVVFQDAFDRISWNAIGTEWNIPIRAVDIKLTAPASFENKVLKINCYRGVYGVAQTCGFGSVQKTGAEFKANNVGQNKGITIDIDLKKGTVLPLTFWERSIELFKKWWPVAIPLFTFFGLLTLWYKKGRDPKGRGTIITQFDAPAGLTPAEVGTIVDQGADNKDIFAEIIYLATKGYLKIFREEKKGLLGSEDYTLTLLKATSQVQNVVDQKLLQSLFKHAPVNEITSDSEKRVGTVKLSSLKNKFYVDLKMLKETLYSTLTSAGYFKTNPSTVKARYIFIGFILVVAAIFFNGISSGFEELFILKGSLIASGILFVVFGIFMPARTQKGVETKEYILGFKNYLTVAEKDRIDFHNAPEKNPATFEKFLPYAMVLGVEKIWAQQFADLSIQPSWYGSSSGSAFNAIAFTSGLSHFSSVAKSSMASTPSRAGGSGGGGFSGGGFGGGGGGSW